MSVLQKDHKQAIARCEAIRNPSPLEHRHADFAIQVTPKTQLHSDLST